MLALAGLVAAQEKPTGALVDRVGSTGFVQVRAESFRALEPRQQILAYWLSQASIAIDPIIYDQNSRFGLRQKRILDAIAAHPDAVDPRVLPQIMSFTKLFWTNKGNHQEITAQKFLPDASFEDLKAAALAAKRKGALTNITEPDLIKELDALRASLFDPNFEPLITAKSPKGDLDILQSSANNFYSGVKLADLKNFKERYSLNSRVTRKPDGSLVEEVYRAGTPDGKVPAGLYAQYLRKANEAFEKAIPYAEPAQQKVLRDLIRYYQTGELDRLASVRHRLDAERRRRRFRQRLHRSLSRRARGQRHLAELRFGPRTRPIPRNSPPTPSISKTTLLGPINIRSKAGRRRALRPSKP